MKRTGAVSRSLPVRIGLLPLRRMPRAIGLSGIALRPLKLADGFTLSEIRSTDNHFGHSRVLKWWNVLRCWFLLRRIFPLIYAIEKGSRVVGFTGLYDIRAGRSAEMSLWIKEGERRRGTGTEAASMLIGASGSSGLVRELIVKIDPDNDASSSFWQKLGFSLISSNSCYRVMKKAIGMGAD